MQPNVTSTPASSIWKVFCHPPLTTVSVKPAPLAKPAKVQWRAALRDMPKKVPATHQMAVVSAWFRKTNASNWSRASMQSTSGCREVVGGLTNQAITRQNRR
jgi:hypothetical protein